MDSTYRILHVEDSPDDAELVRLALRRAEFGFEIRRVDEEGEFLEALASFRPDVILCDYDMPRFSAERALQLRGDQGVTAPFIVVSNHIDQSAAVVAMQQGASDYLPKRSLGRLPKAITVALDRAQAHAEHARAEQALRASEAMTRGILESLGSRIAVVDESGRIVAANRAWLDFEGERAERGIPAGRVGDNYLEALRFLAGAGNEAAAKGLEAIGAVMRREVPFASVDYQLGGGSGNRWYLARAAPLSETTHVVVSHEDITQQMLSHMALDDAHRRLQALSKRVLSIQEEERRAISRELHDDVGQTLAALKIGLHRLGQSGVGGELLGECVSAADEALEKLRQLAQQLRPPQLDQLGLPAAVTWLGGVLQRASGVEIEVEAAGFTRRPAPSLEIACYRIAQEAMNNAVRHGKARSVNAMLEMDDSLLRLSVSDNGGGFDADVARQRALESGSLGIIGMEERAQLAGGRLRIRSTPGAGTTVTALFPLAERARETRAGVGSLPA